VQPSVFGESGDKAKREKEKRKKDVVGLDMEQAGKKEK
jgi:hypothetical protein